MCKTQFQLEQEEWNLLFQFRDFFGVQAQLVVDPVFLISKKEWMEIAQLARIKETDEYLLAYILNPTNEKKKLIEDAGKKLGLKIHVIVDASDYDNKKDLFNDQGLIEKPSFEEWLFYLYNAKYIITDSFHGTCLSIIFEKRFISIKNRQKQRFDSLAAMTGIGDKLFYESAREVLSNDIVFPTFDYQTVKSNLNSNINGSKLWLRTSLSKKAGTHDDSHRILIDYAALYRKYLSVIED